MRTGVSASSTSASTGCAGRWSSCVRHRIASAWRSERSERSCRKRMPRCGRRFASCARYPRSSANSARASPNCVPAPTRRSAPGCARKLCTCSNSAPGACDSNATCRRRSPPSNPPMRASLQCQIPRWPRCGLNSHANSPRCARSTYRIFQPCCHGSPWSRRPLRISACSAFPSPTRVASMRPLPKPSRVRSTVRLAACARRGATCFPTGASILRTRGWSRAKKNRCAASNSNCSCLRRGSLPCSRIVPATRRRCSRRQRCSTAPSMHAMRQ